MLPRPLATLYQYAPVTPATGEAPGLLMVAVSVALTVSSVKLTVLGVCVQLPELSAAQK